MEKITFINSKGLHIIAMALMLCDHLWALVFTNAEWLTCIGRLTFPIFAFMIAEGIAHTSSLKSYIKRLFIFALISEIPFNLMYSSSPIYPFHQNVIWTFLIAVLLICLIEKAKSRGSLLLTAVTVAAALLAGYILGFVLMTDYYGIGILTVLLFYFFRQKTWWSFVCQLIGLYWLNVEMLGGLTYEIDIFGYNLSVVQQGLAVFALIPIWLYNGQPGKKNKTFQMFCYWFYPAHMLLLYIIAIILH